jgi:hypothetical protein
MKRKAKTRVEECLILDVFKLARKGALDSGASGTIDWRANGRPFARVSWRFEDDCLFLPMVQRDEMVNHNHYPIELIRTPGSTYGGERVWFQCPHCGREVRKLYLPPEEIYFLCRTCHRLTYESRQKRFVDVGERLWKRADKQRELLKHLQEQEDIKDQRRVAHAQANAQADLATFARSLEVRQTPATPAPSPKRPRGRPKEKRPYHRRHPLTISERTSEEQGYCVKCRDLRDIKDPRPVVFSNGRSALQGTCPVCERKLARVIKGK